MVSLEIPEYGMVAELPNLANKPSVGDSKHIHPDLQAFVKSAIGASLLVSSSVYFASFRFTTEVRPLLVDRTSEESGAYKHR